MAWVSPTGHNELDDWINPQRAYDDDLGLYALGSKVIGSACEFTHAALWCDKIQYQLEIAGTFDIDIYYSGAYHNLWSGYQGIKKEWIELEIGSTESVTKVKFTNQTTVTYLALMEVDFNETGAPPPTRRIFITHQ